MARQIKKVDKTEISSQTTQSNRKLMRNILRARLGSNRIRTAWHNAQVTRYGEKELQIIYTKNTTLKHRRSKSALFA